MDSNCTLSYLDSQPDKCAAIQSGICASDVNVLDLFWVFYCPMKGHLYYLVPSGLVFLFFLFDVISSTCENWLTVPLTKIGKSLHFSEALSGVTLIALSNGSPDVFASFSAAGQSSANGTATFLAVGSIFGANLFTTTIVLFRVLINTESIRMQYQTILRDLIFFIGATCAIISFGIYGEINSYMTLGYIGVYLTYCIVVVIQERTLERMSTRKNDNESEDEDEVIEESPERQNPENASPKEIDCVSQGSNRSKGSNQSMDSQKRKSKLILRQLEKEMMKDIESRIFRQEAPDTNHIKDIIQNKREFFGMSLQPVDFKPSFEQSPESNEEEKQNNLLAVPLKHEIKSKTPQGSRRSSMNSMIENAMEYLFCCCINASFGPLENQKRVGVCTFFTCMGK